jgi:RNA-directed DNA polymerase
VAPLAKQDGTVQQRVRGTPQGSAVSPVLANLYLHYAFDVWLTRNFPHVTFERYCDDAVIHCKSERQARRVRDALAERLAQVGLELHPDKTQGSVKFRDCAEGWRSAGRGGQQSRHGGS